MKIFDRYIILQFLLNFVILFVVIMTLFVLVDLIVDLDEFLKAGRNRATSGGTWSVLGATLWRIADWYGPMIVLIYTFVSGLLVVAAMAFTFSQLVRSGEVVALLTGGISLYRLAAPVLVVGCLLNALTLLNQELVIPKLTHKLVRKKSQVKEDVLRTFAVHYAPDDAGNLISSETFDPAHSIMDHMVVLQRNSLGQAVKRISARQARWDDHREGWELTDAYRVSRSVTDEVAGGRFSAPEPEPIAFYQTSLSPHVLLARRASIYPSLLSLVELRSLVNNPAADSGRIYQIMHSRFSLMVVNVLLLVLALPFFLLREPADLLRQAVKAVCVTLGAWGIGLLLLQIGGPKPVLAAWLPVVILTPVSAMLLQLVKT